jgi:hypothetical protein
VAAIGLVYLVGCVPHPGMETLLIVESPGS